MRNLGSASLFVAVLGLVSVIHAQVQAQTVFTQGLVVPESINLNDSVDIICFNEPAHPLGVNGRITVFAPDDNYTTGVMAFVVGDYNNNGVEENYLKVRYPDDFVGASTSTLGEYGVFCDFWSGESELRDEGEGNPITGAFWQNFWVSFQVVPESMIGALAIGGVMAATFMTYMKASKKKQGK
ncbi:MAG: hypothetical protein QW574_02080 [Candidatus Nitrosocaldus sp.]